MFTDVFLAHFLSPYNAGPMENPDAIGKAGDPACGDALEISIRVEEGVLADVKFMVFGCAASIATSSMTTVLSKKKTLEEALCLTEQDVVDALGGLPAEKVHCSNLGIGALHQAIRIYQERMEINQQL